MNPIVSFIGKYAEEAGLLARAFRALGTEFLGSQEKTQIDEAISRFEGAAQRIAESLPALEKAQGKVSKAEIKAIVKELLPEIVAAELSKRNQ